MCLVNKFYLHYKDPLKLKWAWYDAVNQMQTRTTLRPVWIILEAKFSSKYINRVWPVQNIQNLDTELTERSHSLKFDTRTVHKQADIDTEREGIGTLGCGFHGYLWVYTLVPFHQRIVILQSPPHAFRQCGKWALAELWVRGGQWRRFGSTFRTATSTNVEMEEETQKLVLLVEQKRKGRWLRSPDQSPGEILYCTFLLGAEGDGENRSPWLVLIMLLNILLVRTQKLLWREIIECGIF